MVKLKLAVGSIVYLGIGELSLVIHIIREEVLKQIKFLYFISITTENMGILRRKISSTSIFLKIQECLGYLRHFQAKIVDLFSNFRTYIFNYDTTHFIKHNKDVIKKHHSDVIYFNKSTLPRLNFGLDLHFSYSNFAEGAVEYLIVINGVKSKNMPLYRFY